MGFHWILIVNLLVLSTESSPDFDIAAQMSKVPSYQNLVMIQCLKLKDLQSNPLFNSELSLLFHIDLQYSLFRVSTHQL